MSMYFDHARCPSCGLAFDPDNVSTRDGQPACPHCGAAMKMVDMFGLADAFAEDEPEPVTLDDLVPGGYDTSYQGQGSERQDVRGGSSQPRGHSGSMNWRPVSREDHEQYSVSPSPTPAHAPSSENLPARRFKRSDDDDGGGRSAMDVLRDLKRR